MVQLICEYKDVFSSGDHDVGLTKAVHHEISLAEVMVPIWQPTRRLGPEKAGTAPAPTARTYKPIK